LDEVLSPVCRLEVFKGTGTLVKAAAAMMKNVLSVVALFYHV